MITPRILASGTFTPDDVSITAAASNRKIDEKVESQLEDAWQDMLDQAKKRAEPSTMAFRAD